MLREMLAGVRVVDDRVRLRSTSRQSNATRAMTSSIRGRAARGTRRSYRAIALTILPSKSSMSIDIGEGLRNAAAMAATSWG